jgi:hypothetical protein
MSLLSFFSLFFFLVQNWIIGKQNRSCQRWVGVGTSGRGEVEGKGGRKVNIVQKCVHMYVNAKMIAVETIVGMEWGE